MKNRFFSKKRIFHLLTNINEKSSYSSEIYLEKNSDMLSSAPLNFLMDLARISFHYGISDKDSAVTLSGKKVCDFTNMYYRYKSVLVFKSFEKYKCIIIDVWDTLLYRTLDNDEIYKIVENKNKTDGFAAERKKYDGKDLSINEIYEKINEALGTELTSENEIEIYRKSILKNRYVSEITDMLAANHIKTIPIVSGCYGKEFYNKLFKDKKIYFSDDAAVTDESGRGYTDFIKKLIGKAEKEDKISAEECLVYSSDYKNCVKPLRSANYNSTYYYPPKTFYKKYNYPEMRDIQGKIYENIVSYELFGYKNMKSREYSAIFAYLAPVITDILENIFKYGKDKKIIFIGSNENMIYRLYKRYYDFKDDALITDWSYFMAEYSESREADKFKSYKENLREIYENMPSLRCIPDDRILYSLESESGEDMASDKKRNSDTGSEKVGFTYAEKYMKASLDYYLEELKKEGKERNDILVVDLTEKNSGGGSFLKVFKNVYPYINVAYYSWYKEITNMAADSEEINNDKNADDISKISDSIDSIDGILQRDIPVLLKVSYEEISYVYPVISSLTAAEKMKGAISKYIERHLETSAGESQCRTFSAHDINELLIHGNECLYALGKGGI